VPENEPPVVVCNAAELSEADAATVEALAWLALYARRLGCGLRIEHAPPDLRVLIAFMGLDARLLGRGQFVTEMVTNGRTDTFAAVVAALATIAAAPDGIISSKAVAAELGLNPVVVRRLLGPMRAAGIVEARRGVGGGWAIARDPALLPLGDIHRAMASERRRSGLLEQTLRRADAAFVAELDRSMLADVMPDSATGHPAAIRNR
jgi:DNA-binding IscR family transcriptional regulator